MKEKERSPEFAAELEKDAGRGLSHRLSDYSDFLPQGEDAEAALAAAQLLDGNGDPTKLIELLAMWVPPNARPFIEDIFERYSLKRKHKRRVPGYEVTEAGWAMLMAVAHVKRLAPTQGVEAAIDTVSKTDNVDPNSLEESCKGRSGWFNELQRRLARFATDRPSPRS